MAKKKKSTKKAAPKKKAAKKAVKKARKVSPVPPGYHTVTPYLVCRNASDAIAFYKKAFGAKELFRMPMPDGSIAHAEIMIGDSHVMIGDENPQMGGKSPQALGGSPVYVFLYVKDVDAVFNKAAAAGATVTMPLMDMFWGDRYGKLSDPYGHQWSLATHIEDVSPKEMARRSADAFSQPPGGSQ
jgi:PhnB protein